MNKILSILLSLLLTSSIYSQTTITSSYFELCDFNLSTGLISDDCPSMEAYCVFTVSEDEKEVTHQSDGKLSTYKVTDSSFDEQTSEYTMRVVGLFSQDYVIIIDPVDANVKVFFKNEYSEIVVLIYHIDNIY